MRRTFIFTVIALAALAPFQNCAKVGFDRYSGDSKLGRDGNPNDSNDAFTTDQDVPLTGRTQSATAIALQPSSFSALTSPSSGTLTSIDPATGEFVYTPNQNYFGRDQFQLTEANPGLKRTVVRTVTVDVVRVGQPYVLSDVFNFDVNTANNRVKIEVGCKEVADPWADLSPDGTLDLLKTANGTLVRTQDGFAYTPNADFRGTDKVKIYARDSRGGLGAKEIKLITGNPLQNIQPGMAVRASNCIQCHAQISSNFVTDFGYGDSYYFGKDHANPTGGDYVYSLRLYSNPANGKYHPEWITSAAFANGAKLIVPKADLGFKFADYAPSFVNKNTPWLQATTVAGLMRDIQMITGATFKADVVEKTKIYIGAPTVADLKTAGRLDSANPLRYWKDSDLSYNLAGITKAAAGHYTNTDIIACDGDLFIDGTVFLNAPKIKTISGCRLHATGPIFMQKAITYMTDPAAQANANLQLVSARAITMGIGLTHCEAATDPNGWYARANVSNPLKTRYVTFNVDKGVMTRNTDPKSGFPLTSNSSTAEGEFILAEAQKIQELDDASCHGRGVNFERLMLIAPQIHSRYKGNFSGVVIGEYPLFSLQSFVYQFDQVFLKVPVIPLLNMDKILLIQ